MVYFNCFLNNDIYEEINFKEGNFLIADHVSDSEALADLSLGELTKSREF